MTDEQNAEPLAERDPEFIRRVQPLVDTWAAYFRPEVRGFEHLPPQGPFLLAGNHSGGAMAPDMPILMSAWWKARGVEEPVYGLFHSTMLKAPGLGGAVKKAGALEAGVGQAERALEEGAVVLVYPGGDFEAYRPSTQRDVIDFAGRSGFIRLALRTQVPIVPVVSCGAHDTVIVLSRGERLAKALPYMRALRVKTYPILLGPPWGLSLGIPTFPLPGAKVTVQICEPIDLGHPPEAADDDGIVAELYDAITSRMQAVLDDLARERGRRD